jgi:phosphomethylpyrimidine synthase
VREFARLNPASTTLATSPGVISVKQINTVFEEKAEEFRKGGSELYS